MTIQKNSAVSILYTLKGADGAVIDTSENEPLVYIHGNYNLIPGLEKELEGKEPGAKISCVIQPEDAYGVVDPELVFELEKAAFAEPDKIEVGMQFQSGDESAHIVTVTKIEGDKITVDANHPLAGQTLYFDVEVVDVREATEEELSGDEGGCGCGCDCNGDCESNEGCNCGGSCN